MLVRSCHGGWYLPHQLEEQDKHICLGLFFHKRPEWILCTVQDDNDDTHVITVCSKMTEREMFAGGDSFNNKYFSQGAQEPPILVAECI